MKNMTATRKNIWSYLPRLQRARCSPLQALARVVHSEDLERIAARCRDWRELIDVAQTMLNQEPKQFFKRIAREMGMRYQEHVEPADLLALDPDLNISRFRRLGAIPVTEEGGIAAVVCIDPIRIIRLGTEFERVPFFFAPWAEIASALETSERLYRELHDPARAQSGEQARFAVTDKILGLLLQEAESYGAISADISFAGEEIQYRFMSDSGKSGFGSIGQEVRARMRDLLERACVRGGAYGFMRGARWQDVTIEREAALPHVYRLRWKGERKPVDASTLLSFFPNNKVAAGGE
jgi:hypothetical protein